MLAKRGKRVAIGGLILLGVLLAAALGGRLAMRRFLYPEPPPLPAGVDTPVDELLTRLESLLRERAPQILTSLRPGLSPESLAALEAEAGLVLTDELRALYAWHDGSEVNASFVPNHGFASLESALALRAEALHPSGIPLTQRLVGSIFIGHRKGWLPVFEDGCGDGYFYDPARRNSGGSFFYNFAEDTSYLYFPSFKSFLAALVECYEVGACGFDAKGQVTCDFQASEKIWQRHGARR